mmetsp:Transcript_24966/g.99154  ORF Transcript_24966/g.99154 Transcript_24966/m.99154 type:complete len:546 (+) Transcript_24966:869-2506(+)
MALDQIPNTGKYMRFKIMRNIGDAFVRLGQFSDAVQSYETIMGGDADTHTGFNLLLCYYALGDTEKLRRGFHKLITIPLQPNCNGIIQHDAHEATQISDDCAWDCLQPRAYSGSSAEIGNGAGLNRESLQRERLACTYKLTAARLVAPQLPAPNDNTFGFKLIIDALKPGHEPLASKMELERALQCLRQKEFHKAIDFLKAFEQKDKELKATAATNLSFIYFLEGNLPAAEKYADLAYEQDRYNARALVNKGNCLTVKDDLRTAKQFYLEAIGVEADCIEAIYNLGLINRRLQLWNEALQAFEKVHQTVPGNAEVIYHIAALYEARGDLAAALKWYNILVSRLPSDPGILLKLGQVCSRIEDEFQAFHFHLEAYRHYPVALDVISWLGVWYVKSEMYEKAIKFFQRASQIQPCEVKWQLMVTSCYRRMGNYHHSLRLYQCIHATYPDNAECLRYLVAICKDLGQPCDNYRAKLLKIDSGTLILEAGAHMPGIQDCEEKLPSKNPKDLVSLQPPVLEAASISDGRSSDGFCGLDFETADVGTLLPG